MSDIVQKIAGKNFATGFVLVVYVLSVAAMWIYCTIQVNVMVEIPPNVLKIGVSLLTVHGGVNITDKFKQPQQ